MQAKHSKLVTSSHTVAIMRMYTTCAIIQLALKSNVSKMGCGWDSCQHAVRIFSKFCVTTLNDFCDVVERIGDFDWFRKQYLVGKKRTPFTFFNRDYISSQFNFKFKRNVRASHVGKVEVELYEGIYSLHLPDDLDIYQFFWNSDTITDLIIAINADGNEFYSCSLLCKWSNIQIFDCRNPSITDKWIEDIEIRAVGKTSLKQVNAMIQPGNYQNNFRQSDLHTTIF